MRRLFLAALLIASPRLAQAQPQPASVGTVIVVGRAPLGAAQGGEQMPGAVTTLDADDLRPGSGSVLLDALERQAPGVSLSNAQGEAYQPSLLYRGFEASPLQGVDQGLAVYVDGVRLNQPFGETVNWDLIPEAAIKRITLQGANPTFGLNALGGSLAVQLKDGFEDPGGEIEASGGSFGRSHAELQYGATSDRWGAFVAASGLHDPGWRRFSPSTLRQAYASFGFRPDDRLRFHLGLTGADNDLTGNGPAPVELLAVDRRAVFTHPDRTRNRFAQAQLSAEARLDPDSTLDAQIYVGRLEQRTANGDSTDATPCAGAPAVLCLDADGPLLTDAAGAAIPAFLGAGPYAVLNASTTATDRAGGALQYNRAAVLLGRDNDLLAGASLDISRTLFGASTALGGLTPDRGFGGPGVLVDQAGGPIAPVGLAARTRYLGLYASDRIEATRRLTLTLSARYDAAELKLEDRIGAALNGDHRFHRINPAAGLTYRLAPRLVAYAGYAEGSRAPTPAELSCASPADPCSLTDFFLADPALKLVTAATWEAGLRGSGRRGGLSYVWSAGLFRTEARNEISRVASDVRGRGFFENIGRTRRQGIEAQAELARGRWRGFASYSFTDATFRAPLTLASPDNPAADENGQIQVRPGDRMPGVPRQRVKAGVSYVARRFRLSLDAVASSGRPFAGDEANLQPEVPGYVVANLAGALHLTGRVELFGSIENLTDRHYATFGAFSPTASVPIAEAPGASDPRSLTPGPPRMYELGLRLSF